MSDNGSATAAIGKEDLDSYLFEAVRQALAAGKSASTWAAGLLASAGEGDLTLEEGATITIPSHTGTYDGVLTIGPGDAGNGSDDDFVIANTNGSIGINVGGGNVVVTAAQLSTTTSLRVANDISIGAGTIQAENALAIGTVAGAGNITLTGGDLSFAVGAQAARKVPIVNVHATDAPGATDDITAGYRVGDLWLRVSTTKLYVCSDNTGTAAVWNILN